MVLYHKRITVQHQFLLHLQQKCRKWLLHNISILTEFIRESNGLHRFFPIRAQLPGRVRRMGGKEMVRMEEEKELPYNYRQCGAIWKRVAPELEPYPQEEALMFPTEKGTPSQEAERLLHRALQRRQQYLLRSQRTEQVSVRKTLQELAAGEGLAARRLAAVYCVLSGTRWDGPKKCDLPPQPPEQAVCCWLRDTEADSRALRALAGELEETCLRRSLEQLAAEAQCRASVLLRLLEGNGLA